MWDDMVYSTAISRGPLYNPNSLKLDPLPDNIDIIYQYYLEADISLLLVLSSTCSSLITNDSSPSTALFSLVRTQQYQIYALRKCLLTLAQILRVPTGFSLRVPCSTNTNIIPASIAHKQLRMKNIIVYIIPLVACDSSYEVKVILAPRFIN